MRYPLSSFFLRADVAHRSKAAHIARSSPHQVVGIHHAKRFDVDEILYQHCVKKLLVGYLLGSAWARRYAPRAPTSTCVSTSVRTLSSKKKGLPCVRSIRSWVSGVRLGSTPSKAWSNALALAGGSGSSRSGV